MHRLIGAIVFLTALILSPPVWAHTDDSLDAMPSPHGGQVRAAGPYHLELVAKDGELILYVTDHADNGIHTIGGEGKAHIQRSKTESRITVTLEPSEHNMLTGSGEFQIDPKTEVVVFLKLPEQDAYAARFTPLKPKSVGVGKKAPGNHHHDDHHEHH